MKCIVNNQVVLSQPPEGPLAAQIGSFAESIGSAVTRSAWQAAWVRCFGLPPMWQTLSPMR
jgi:hypothetical protein